MQQIKVLFFARLREQLQKAGSTVETDITLDVAEVWRRSSGKDSLPANILISVNQEYAAVETLVQPGDEVAFFPPVTGG